jgi:hypothetical protein
MEHRVHFMVAMLGKDCDEFTLHIYAWLAEQLRTRRAGDHHDHQFRVRALSCIWNALIVTGRSSVYA